VARCGADAVFLPEREVQAGQALAIAFPLLRLDLHQHRTESLVGDDGARLDVRVLVEEDAAREDSGVSEGTRTPDLLGHKARRGSEELRDGRTLTLSPSTRGLE
jgi:hypothetical protein